MFTKIKRYLLPFLCLVAVLGVNLYFRSFPIFFPQLRDQAKSMVDQQINQAVTQEVAKKFPQYDWLAKDRLVKTQTAEIMQQPASRDEINKKINELYLRFKDRYKDENGQTYMMELDCWHWSRYVANVLYFGHPGDEIVDGKQVDKLMLAPDGLPLGYDNFLFYFSAFLYQIFSWFKAIPLLTFLFYLPLLFSAIFITVLFCFAFYHGRYMAAIFSCLFVGLSISLIPRSCAGWFDKDVLNLIFPLLVIWTYLIAYNARSLRSRLFWIAFAAFWQGLFCWTWASWWFIFVIVIGYELFELAVLLFKRWFYTEDNLKLFKQHIISLAAFVVFSLVWIIIFCGLEPLGFLFSELEKAVFLSQAVSVTIWPNVYSTVGELKRLSPVETVNSLGGPFIFFPAVIGMVSILIRNLVYRQDKGFKSQSAVILMLWTLSMFAACLQGVRFVVFLAIPISIFLGWILNDLYEFAKTKGLKWQGFLAGATIIVLLGVNTIPNADKLSKGIFPLMNDTWYRVLVLMRNNTPTDTVINSWWDFGDWFKVVSNRKVIFDGQSQNVPQAYWMGKAILSNSENEAVGILRMLNNGGNKAFDVVNEYLKDPLQSILLLESIIPLDSGRAKEILKDFLPTAAADKLTFLLFEKPGNACFVVDSSMIQKTGAISFLGNWNFAKIYIVQNFKKMEKDDILDHLVKLGKNREEMERIYQEAFLIPDKDKDSWISQPLQFFSGLVKGTQQGDIVVFENGFIYNQKNQTVYTNNGQIPRSLFKAEEDGSLTETVYPNANVIFSVLVYKNQEGINAIFLHRELANSLFTRLYFLRGKGLKNFKTLVEAEENRDYIGVYKIDW